MAGLYLGRGQQSFTATAASPPSTSGTTVTQQAYGTSQGGPGPSTAKNGTLISGVAGTLILLFLWYSLPR